MALTPCLVCGRLITRGLRCPQCKLRRPSGNQWRPTRTIVLQRDGWRCKECGGPANVVDHIEPIARGGTDDPSNLQAMCAGCIGAKGDRY